MVKLCLLILLLFSLLTACTGTPTNISSPVGSQSVSIQLSWFHEYSSAPFHVALRQGFFSQAGIDVRLVEGGFGETGYIDPIQQVVDETVDFGMSDAQSLIQARANGLELIAVANILQRNPLALMTLDKRIQHPDDLIGHSILVADGGARIGLESFLDIQGIALDAVTIISRTDFGVEPLVNAEVDVLVAWRINEGVSLEELGLDPTFFLLSDYGVENYDFLVFTNQRMVDENPDLVLRLVGALRQGIDYVISNPSQAIDATLSFNPELNREAQLRRLEATIPLMNLPSIPYGSMDPEVWQFVYDLLARRGLLARDFELSTVYTLNFIQSGD